MNNELIHSNTAIRSDVKAFMHAGDIAQVDSDALITAINSSGMWFGGIDGVIGRHAGDQFHDQARSDMPLKDGQTLVAMQRQPHTGHFRNVVFVVDDLKRRLSDVIFAGLKAADDAGFRVVSLPAIRMGVMLGVVEKSVQEAAEETREGILRFIESNPRSVQELHFVVFRDPTTQAALSSTITKLLPSGKE